MRHTCTVCNMQISQTCLWQMRHVCKKSRVISPPLCLFRFDQSHFHRTNIPSYLCGVCGFILPSIPIKSSRTPQIPQEPLGSNFLIPFKTGGCLQKALRITCKFSAMVCNQAGLSVKLCIGLVPQLGDCPLLTTLPLASCEKGHWISLAPPFLSLTLSCMLVLWIAPKR